MYTTKEAATVLGVSTETVRKYTRRKEKPLKAARVGLRLDLRISEEDLLDFARVHKMSVFPLEQHQN